MTTEPLDRAEALQEESVRLRNLRVLENQGLVHKIARGYRRSARGVPVEDLVQFGNLGLMRAAEKFEPERGWRFSTYATYWIRQAIGKGIANTARPIRVPLHAQREAAAVRRRAKSMELESGTRPGLAEVMDAMEARGETSPARRGRLLCAAEADGARFGVKPLEEVAGEVHPGDSPSSVAIGEEHREQLGRALPLLADAERRVLEGRYGLDGTPPAAPRAIAGRLGVARPDVARLERRAIDRLAARLAPPSRRGHRVRVGEPAP